MQSTRFRINAVQSQGLALTRLALTDSGGALVASAITSTFVPQAGAVANLAQASNTATCLFGPAQTATPGFSIVLEFASPVNPTGVLLGGGADAGAWPREMVLEYWDGAAWQIAGTLSGAGAAASWPGHGATVAWQLYEFNNNLALLLDGTAALDVSGRWMPIVTVGAVRSVVHDGLPALRFDGQGHRLELPSSAVPTGAFCLELIVCPDAGSGRFALLGQGGAWAHSDQLLYAREGDAVSALRQENAGPAYEINSSTILQRGVYTHVALDYDGTMLRLFVAGSLAGSATTSPGWSAFSGRPVMLGAHIVTNYHNFQSSFSGYMRHVRFTGASRYTAPFTPPASLLDGYRTPLLPGAKSDAALYGRDMEFGGRSSITGDVGIKGANGGPDMMVRSRVRLLRQRDGLLARETWSDAITGAFAFHGLDEAQQFIALAEDGGGVYAPVAADRRVPEVPT